MMKSANITASPLRLTVRMRCEKNQHGGTLVARNANETMVAPMVESDGVCVWQEFGVRSQAVGFVLVRLAGIWLQSP
jgi:hypothetical protein